MKRRRHDMKLQLSLLPLLFPSSWHGWSNSRRLLSVDDPWVCMASQNGQASRLLLSLFAYIFHPTAPTTHPPAFHLPKESLDTAEICSWNIITQISIHPSNLSASSSPPVHRNYISVFGSFQPDVIKSSSAYVVAWFSLPRIILDAFLCKRSSIEEEPSSKRDLFVVWRLINNQVIKPCQGNSYIVLANKMEMTEGYLHA